MNKDGGEAEGETVQKVSPGNTVSSGARKTKDSSQWVTRHGRAHIHKTPKSETERSNTDATSVETLSLRFRAPFQQIRQTSGLFAQELNV